MKYILLQIFVIFNLFFSFVSAKEVKYLIDHDLPLLKGSKIKVTNYDNFFKVYEVVSVKYPNEGASYTKLPYIKAAVKNFKYEIYKEFPQKLVGEEISLTKDLVTLKAPDEVPE
jgi:hypothetical protein